jgi:hypothetical protein
MEKCIFQQFNILIQKWKEVNLMENGLPIHTSAITALSADLSGFVEVSLWGRTFKSLVRNRSVHHIILKKCPLNDGK